VLHHKLIGIKNGGIVVKGQYPNLSLVFHMKPQR
jgi:hypothetical protein